MAYSSEYFSRSLKVERTKRGWTQNDLANISGVSLNAIAKYEIGAHIPSFDSVCKLATALGCPTDAFWERT